jgi:hypothetical protein
MHESEVRMLMTYLKNSRVFDLSKFYDKPSPSYYVLIINIIHKNVRDNCSFNLLYLKSEQSCTDKVFLLCYITLYGTLKA